MYLGATLEHVQICCVMKSKGIYELLCVMKFMVQVETQYLFSKPKNRQYMILFIFIKELTNLWVFNFDKKSSISAKANLFSKINLSLSQNVEQVYLKYLQFYSFRTFVFESVYHVCKQRVCSKEEYWQYHRSMASVFYIYIYIFVVYVYLWFRTILNLGIIRKESCSQ